MSEQDTGRKKNGDKTVWSESPYLIIKGFLMGSADIVPGVSGGTMALITGIYNRLIFAIRSVDYDTVRNALALRFNKVFEHFHWKFLILLFTGIFLAIFFFTRVVPLQVYMFTHPELVYGLFFGLIVGSIVLLMAEIESASRTWKNLLPMTAGILFGFWVVTLVPADTPETFWFIFLSGAVSICAMILPGISGSYILLIFRKYDYVLTQLGKIGSADTFTGLMNLVPFVLGAVIGLVLFSRVLSWLLKNYYARTLLLLIGFLIGSLYVIWPYQERIYEESVRSVRVLPASDPLVQELMARDEIPEAARYQRVGRVINPDAAFEEFRQVEVETVSRKLISNRPYLPWREGEEVRQETNVSGGLTGIVSGLLMIFGIYFLREKSVNGNL